MGNRTPGLSRMFTLLQWICLQVAYEGGSQGDSVEIQPGLVHPHGLYRSSLWILRITVHRFQEKNDGQTTVVPKSVGSSG